jgi:hypothetical protein
MLLLAPIYIRRVADGLIVIGAGQPRMLRDWGIDRAYFVGLGVSLLFTAAMSAVGLTAAVVIAFHIKPLSTASLVIAIAWFLGILGLDRWLVCDPKAGFAASGTSRAGVAAQWLAHFLGELVKISVRVVLGVLGAWLFANFLLLIVFAPEIQQQIKNMETASTAQYTAQIDQLAQQLAAPDQAKISQATDAIKTIQSNFNTGASAINAAEQAYSSGVAQLAKEGIECRYITNYQRRYDASGHYQLVPVTTYSCPQAVINLQNTLNAVESKYPTTPQQEQSQIDAVNQAYGIAQAQTNVKNAKAQAQQELANNAPTNRDGLLMREHALDLLTTKPVGTCPSVPTMTDLANNPACVSQYSPRAAGLKNNLTWWLMAIELAPVSMKFVTAITPRRGYASKMAELDYLAKTSAQSGMATADLRVRSDIAREERLARIEVEVAGALREKEIRTLAQEEARARVGRIRELFSRARPLAIDPAPDTTPEVADAEIVEEPDNQRRGDGDTGSIDSEDFLY